MAAAVGVGANVGRMFAKQAGQMAGKQALRQGAKQAAKQGAKQGAKQAAKQGAKQAAKQGTKQAAKKGAQQAAKKGAKQVAKKGAKQAAKKGTKQVAKKGTKQVAKKGAKQAAKKGVKQASKKGTKQAAKKGAKQAAKKGTKQAAKKGARKGVRTGAKRGFRTGVKRSGKQAAKKTGKQAAKKTEKQAAKKIGKQATKKTGKQAAKKTGKQATKKTGKQAAKKTGKQAGKKTGKKAGKDAGKKAKKGWKDKLKDMSEHAGDIMDMFGGDDNERGGQMDGYGVNTPTQRRKGLSAGRAKRTKRQEYGKDEDEDAHFGHGSKGGGGSILKKSKKSTYENYFKLNKQRKTGEMYPKGYGPWAQQTGGGDYGGEQWGPPAGRVAPSPKKNLFQSHHAVNKGPQKDPSTSSTISSVSSDTSDEYQDFLVNIITGLLDRDDHPYPGGQGGGQGPGGNASAQLQRFALPKPANMSLNLLNAAKETVNKKGAEKGDKDSLDILIEDMETELANQTSMNKLLTERLQKTTLGYSTSNASAYDLQAAHHGYGTYAAPSPTPSPAPRVPRRRGIRSNYREPSPYDDYEDVIRHYPSLENLYSNYRQSLCRTTAYPRSRQSPLAKYYYY